MDGLRGGLGFEEVCKPLVRSIRSSDTVLDSVGDFDDDRLLVLAYGGGGGGALPLLLVR